MFKLIVAIMIYCIRLLFFLTYIIDKMDSFDYIYVTVYASQCHGTIIILLDHSAIFYHSVSLGNYSPDPASRSYYIAYLPPVSAE